MSAYSETHRFFEGGRGTLRGAFGPVVDLYVRCKRSRAVEFIMTGEVCLELAEAPQPEVAG